MALILLLLIYGKFLEQNTNVSHINLYIWHLIKFCSTYLAPKYATSSTTFIQLVLAPRGGGREKGGFEVVTPIFVTIYKNRMKQKGTFFTISIFLYANFFLFPSQYHTCNSHLLFLMPFLH